MPAMTILALLAVGIAATPTQATGPSDLSRDARGGPARNDAGAVPVDSLSALPDGLFRPGDWNDDGAVDLADYAVLASCLTGPATVAAQTCAIFDANADGRVDLVDAAVFQIALPWSANPVLGDWDFDGDFDIVDYVAVPPCVSGPVAYAATGCSVFDFNADGHVSLRDIAGLELVFDPDRPTTPCGQSSPSWWNAPMSQQAGVFAAEFDATPYGTAIDGLTTISAGAAGAFADSAILIRFNTFGTIDARDGAVYAADTTVPYVADQTYHFRLEVNIPAHTYTVYVTPPSAPERILAADYAFRTEQSSVTALDHWGLWAMESHEVCNFRTAPPASPALCAEPNALAFGTTLNALPLHVWNCGNGALDYTVTDNATWLNVSPSGGTSTGETDTVTVTVDRAALPAGSYQAEILVQVPSLAVSIPILVTMSCTAGPGTPVTPIARWDVVPHQRIETGATFNCGVVAFSRNGIQNVQFTVNGGTPVDVTEMTYNAQTRVYEYWLPIAAAGFQADGPITVTALVVGHDGATRTLDPLPLVVNPHGTLPRPEAWVAVTGGSDSTGMVNDPTKPFATIGKALDKLRSWMSAYGYGNKADGGIVRLRPGDHMMQNANIWGGVPTVQEWVTLTCDPATGGTRDNTRISQSTTDNQYISSDWLRVDSLTLVSTGSNRPFFQTGSTEYRSIWLSNCVVLGSDRYDLNPHPIGDNYHDKYVTESQLSNLRFAQGEGFPLLIARNLVVEHIGEDAFVQTPLIINVSLNDQDPGPPGGHEWHADAWQSPGITTSAPPPDNNIVYNYRGTDLHYQAIFGRVKALATHNAFVNVFMEMRDPVRSYGPGNEGVGSWLGGTYDHLLIWNCTFIGTATGHDFWFVNEGYTGTPQFQMTNASFRGNLFTRWLTTEGLGWTQAAAADFSDNHYITPTGALTYTPGAAGSYSTGTPGLILDTASVDFGRPLSSSPLVNRMAVPVVPCDLSGRPRTAGCDIGSYEH